MFDPDLKDEAFASDEGLTTEREDGRRGSGFNYRIAALLLLIVLVGVSLGFGLRFLAAFNRPDVETLFGSEAEGGKQEGKREINVLVVGIDRVEGSHRADAIMLAHVDLRKGRVVLVSIPRDTRAYVEGKGWRKINSAYAYGGIGLLRKTVVNMLNLPVDYHVVLDYAAFVKFVDSLGGVRIDVEKHMRYVDRAGGLYIDIPKGEQWLNGEKALQYVRFRMDAMGDIGRIIRHQKFARALLERLSSPEVILKLPSLVKQAFELVETDMTMAQLMALASFFREGNVKNLKTFTLPGNAAYIDGVSYWLADLEAFSKAFVSEEAAEGETISSADSTGETGALKLLPVKRPIAVLNGSGVRGAAMRVGEALRALGLQVVEVGNAKHFDYRSSLVLYGSEEAVEEALILSELVGVPRALVRREEGGDPRLLKLIVGADFERVLGAIDERKRGSR